MLPFDREGRVLLPDLIRKKARLENDALFVGMGRKFRIWNLLHMIFMKVKLEYLNKRRSLDKL